MVMPPERIQHVEREGLRFDVRDEGPLDGEPIVLLHGFPQRSSSWDHVVPLLHTAGLRTFAMDQRGYSPGARPTGRRAYAIDELVGDVAALVDAIGQPVHLVGHDWGAAVAWVSAVRRPELLRTLTAVSVPHPAAMAGAGLKSGQALKSWYMIAFQLPWLPERLLAGRVGEREFRRSGMRDQEIAAFRREIVEDGALTGGLNWYRAVPFWDRSSLRGRVRVPTTYVWSSGDIAVTRAAAEGAERFVVEPYAFVELPGVSHWIPDQAPEALAEAVLARVTTQP